MVLEDRRLLDTSLFGVVSLSSFAGVGLQENAVAGIEGTVNGQPDLMASHYHAQIDWGDGSNRVAADIVPNPGGSSGTGARFLVKGSHVYAQLGTYPVVVYGQGPDGSSTSRQTTSVTVSQMPSGIPGTPPNAITVSLPPSEVDVSVYGAVSLSSFAGVGFQENAVAGIEGRLNGQNDIAITDYHAQINWGDSSSWFTADIVPNPGSSSGTGARFLVKGSHIYAQAGTYPVVVYGQGADGTSTSRQTASVTVSQMPSGIPGTPPNAITPSLPPSEVDVTVYSVVSFSSYAGVGFQENAVAGIDGRLNGQNDIAIADYHAQINWGDSSSWFTADIVPNPGGSSGTGARFLVKGSHIYAQAGTYPVVVYGQGADGTSTSRQTASVTVSQMPSGIAGTPPNAITPPLPPSEVDVTVYSVVSFSSYAGVGFQENAVAGIDGRLNGQDDITITDYHAQINWGDSSAWFTGDIVPNTGSSGTGARFLVKGSHVYARPGSYPVVVYGQGPDGTSTARQTTQVTVTSNPAPAKSLAMTDLPSAVVAGTAFTVTITALDQSNYIATSYTGTVHFTCSDGAASLSANYTFTAADAGVHTFSNGIVLRSAGSQTITVTDTANGSLQASGSVLVSPAAASTLALTDVPAGVVAGTAFTVTVIALDPFNNIATGYTGTVHFTSTDGQATLPADYTFTAVDGGVHTFTDSVILRTAGSQTVAAGDALTGISAIAPVVVTAAPADHFALTAPAQVAAGVPFDLTVTALDPYGNTDINYQGTVHFTTSDTDPGVVLPDDYTFQPNDQGVYTFASGFTLITEGVQTVTATDTADAALAGSATVSVGPGGTPPPGRAGGPDRPSSAPVIYRTGMVHTTQDVLPRQRVDSVDTFFASRNEDKVGFIGRRFKQDWEVDGKVLDLFHGNEDRLLV